MRLFDRTRSGGETLQFQQEVASRWSFETTEGVDPVTVPDEAGTANALTLHGGAVRTDTWQVDVGGLSLDGTGYATAATMPVDTSGSFTLTAWAQAAEAPTESVTVMSAEGGNRPAFQVAFVPDERYPDVGTWRLSIADQDAADAEVAVLDAAEVRDARDWTHLALAYDGVTKEARLYINGSLLDRACADGDGDGVADDPACAAWEPWVGNVQAFKATSFQIGRSRTGPDAGSYFSGLVDDVWVFQGTLSHMQVRMLSASFFDVPTVVPGT
ncbi:LamG domain-containing protein [Streptomyces sp. UH6]|uniref:LamG domain-containing protein n=1 Tax=Streptomyces sp. UH6 TaxID=2748379 RepID=UPI0015D50A8D|nr:LamG domain-containing protein [Streptomyces sp. UH6]NYV75572.1 LamG domain-containing protein [Streptomyces sp. UH6]